ncbi:MAG TPA: sugar phosphate isomerase/epimerase [Clostridiaceae bacterium]|jgi:L-ribulose-5-phosphate 3-epimerase|nr:sugar phosphate isomerase/epimerase [Clostridiaceae bacterium]
MYLSTVTNIFGTREDGSSFPMEESMKMCREVGFKVLDASLHTALEKDNPLSSPDWEKWIDKIANEKEKLGITFESAHLPFFTINDKRFEDEEEIEFFKNSLYRGIHACGSLGVKWAVVHVAHKSEEQGFAPDIKKKAIEFYTPFIEAALKENVGIAFENTTTGNKCVIRYMLTAWELADFIDTVNAPNVGACWDFGHANIIYKDQREALRTLGKRLKATHVHDNFGTTDAHMIPFTGNIQWRPIMETLTEIGYDRAFTFEVSTNRNKPDFIQMLHAKHIYEVGLYLLSLAGKA